jgi:uncharacterized protein (DUF1800 family)
MCFVPRIYQKRLRLASISLFTSLFLCGGYALAQIAGSDIPVLAPSTTPAQYQSSTATSLQASGRILNQATFGPVTSDYIHVEGVGIANYVNEQLKTPPYLMPSVIPAADYSGNGGDCTSGWSCEPEFWWWHNALFGQDQLRQRVAYALSKLFVVSYSEVDARYFPYYLNVLSRDAFSNWFTLMQDVSTSGAMGTYLNAANSQAAPTGGHADENFAREMMQLFSIGTVALNQDGSPQHDANGNTIPNYTPAIVQNFARAYTGYTFANDDCSQPAQPMYYWWPDPPGAGCAMQPLDQFHDTGAKTLLRDETLPAGQGTVADFTAALSNVFNDPSLPPFVCRRLIQNLVKSNPSPAYISRVAAVFINNGSHVRGDMTAVIRAILLDREARADDTATTPTDPNGGLMRDPILWWASVMRSLSAKQNRPAPYDGVYDNVFDLWLTDLGESSHDAPSVFSFYSPGFTIKGGSLYAPEFQLENSASLAWMMLHIQDAIDDNFYLSVANEFSLDLSATSQLGVIAAGQGASGLVDALNALLLHGTMTSDMSSTIIAAIRGQDTATMVRNAVFLVVTSPQYRVML